MSSVLKITQVFTRTITSSTKSSTNIINNRELKNLKASYNILKSFYKGLFSVVQERGGEKLIRGVKFKI